MTREAISKKQEETFLEFVRNDTHFRRYYDGMYILFKTGSTVYIDSPKTYAGTRILPMQDDVYEAFRWILSKRPKRKVEPMIDGYSGFLFLDKDGKPMVAMHWEKYFKHAVDKYNSIYKDQLPRITPHVCRHTYCSNMAKAGMNPKALQYLMGHADIGVTLNTYTHLKIDDAREELLKLAQKQEDADKEIQKLGMRKEKENIRKFGKMD